MFKEEYKNKNFVRNFIRKIDYFNKMNYSFFNYAKYIYSKKRQNKLKIDIDARVINYSDTEDNLNENYFHVLCNTFFNEFTTIDKYVEYGSHQYINIFYFFELDDLDDATENLIAETI